MIQPLFIAIWEESKILNNWSKGIIVITKMGSISNWLGITLLSIPSNILAKMIIQRISGVIDNAWTKYSPYVTSLSSA